MSTSRAEKVTQARRALERAALSYGKWGRTRAGTKGAQEMMARATARMGRAAMQLHYYLRVETGA